MAERNPSKQRRAAQNKAQREALAARRATRPRRSRRPPTAGPSPPRRRRDAGRGDRGGRAPSSVAVPGRAGEDRDGPAEPGRAGRGPPPRVRTSASADTAPAPGPQPVGPPAEGDRPRPPDRAGLRGFLAHLQQIAGRQGGAVRGDLQPSWPPACCSSRSVVPRRSWRGTGRDRRDRAGDQREQGGARTTTPIRHRRRSPTRGGRAARRRCSPRVPVVICGVAARGLAAGRSGAGSSRSPRSRSGIYVVFFSWSSASSSSSAWPGLFFAAYQARKADPPVPRAPGRTDDRRLGRGDDETTRAEAPEQTP